MLHKSNAVLNMRSAKIITVLLFVSMLVLVAATTTAAKAQINPKITLSPVEAAVGATVQISGTGFSPGEPATFVCNNNQMFSPALYADANGIITGNCQVPNFAAGTYQVTAYDSSGMSVSVAFVVTGGGTATASPTSTPSSSSSSGNGNGNSNGNGNGNSNGNGNVPTFAPTTPSSSGGFWSPTMIGIVVAVLIAFVVSGTFLYSRQSRQKMMLDRERERDRERTPYGPEPGQGPYGGGYSQPPSGYGPQPSSYGSSSPSGSRYTPYNYRQTSSSYQSRYSQPSTSSYRPSSTASRYSQPPSYKQQPSSYSRPPTHSKTCPHCKRSVREDQNVCPYCNKRI